MLPLLLLPLLLLTAPTSNAGLQDFCIADLSLPETPAGYPCRNASSVTADDFAFTGFRKAASTNNTGRAGFTTAFVDSFPALNGMGLGMVRFDMAKGGLIPLHSHPGASEVIVVVEGTVTAGLITSTTNKVYVKTLSKGDVMLFPQGLLHFQMNAGDGPALVFISFNSPSPGLQFAPAALFGNDLPSEIVEKITNIGVAEVRRLKALLGGSG